MTEERALAGGNVAAAVVRVGDTVRKPAYAVKGFVPLEDGGDPALDGPRLRALADGYGHISRSRRLG